MCDTPSVPQNFQVGGAVNVPSYDTTPGMVGGRQVGVAGPSADIPGITELAYGLMAEGVQLPDQQVAGFSGDQMDAFGVVREGVGSFQPYLESATDLTQAGVGALDHGRASTLGLGEQIPGVVASGRETIGLAAADVRDATKQGIGGLEKTGGMFDPSSTQPFMNQYEDAAVQQAMQDIARQGQIAGQGLRAQAVGSGAFGGSRQAIAEQELQRNVLGEQGRTAASMRQTGFENAAQRAQAAYEESMRRQQTAAAGIGSLGIEGGTAAGGLGLSGANLGLSGVTTGLGAEKQAADMGLGIASLGNQMVGLGQAGQRFSLQDINNLLSVGGLQRQLTQAEYDAIFANQYQDAMQPYQQLGFASDIITGAPSGQVSTMSQPGPSIGSQVVGGVMAVPAVVEGFQSMGQP